jgi:hypothetical protein
MVKMSSAKKAALSKATKAAQRKRHASSQLESPNKCRAQTVDEDSDEDEDVFDLAAESPII